ncbi:hypothetical protein C3747_520g8 [Trypanosoma cruzi]|uniref:Amastin n=1 Tax=Trypanosoma cruzi TaxID=5693 RepID=A0A2V2UU49_TRYCR|nr:hypothetical protein C3747_520g8 [Trypanosoma cruzi]
MCSFCRVIVLVLAMLATACAVCANIFPVFKKGNDAATVKQTLWYNQTTVSGGVGTKVDVSESLCGQYKLFFQVSEGAAVAAAGIGLVVVLFVIIQMIFQRICCCLGCVTSLLISHCVCRVCGVSGAYCVWVHEGLLPERRRVSSQYGPFKDQGYKFSEAFYLICAACVFFLFPVFSSAVLRK